MSDGEIHYRTCRCGRAIEAVWMYDPDGKRPDVKVLAGGCEDCNLVTVFEIEGDRPQ
jgi:hypothetical protein